jgi:putative membrane protein
MEDFINFKYVCGAVVYSALGLVILAVSIGVFDLCTPKFKIWNELIDKQNNAMGIFLASIVLGVAIIVASAIHG